MSSPDRASLVIDLDALAHNLSVIRAEASGAEVAAVVKADGYGLGAGPIARRLWAEGVRRFFVARLSEGEDLRSDLGDRDATIYVLDGLFPATADRLVAARLTPVIETLTQVHAAQTLAAARGRLNVALQIDTGMNRQGLTPEDAVTLANAPDGLRSLEVTLVMSHLGSATDPLEPRNPDQLTRFQSTRTQFPGALASLAASGGAFLGPDFRFDLVRAGVTLYGGGPEERPDRRLRAVATLSAPILDVRSLRPGDRVSYGNAFTAERPMRVAIIAAGYADGLIRAAMGRANAWIDGRPHRLIAVNMDLAVLDLGDTAATPGDSVEVLGPNAQLDDLAAAAGTVAHEVLVRLSRRAERIYVGGS
jgi:alanine racemase